MTWPALSPGMATTSNIISPPVRPSKLQRNEFYHQYNVSWTAFPARTPAILTLFVCFSSSSTSVFHVDFSSIYWLLKLSSNKGPENHSSIFLYTKTFSTVKKKTINKGGNFTDASCASPCKLPGTEVSPRTWVQHVLKRGQWPQHRPVYKHPPKPKASIYPQRKAQIDLMIR